MKYSNQGKDYEKKYKAIRLYLRVTEGDCDCV